MIVVDATVLAVALADDAADGDQARARLRDEVLLAPELVDLEVTSVWRRLEAVGHLDARRGSLAVADLAAIPLRRVPHRALLPRCWELRANLTVYDAAYVAVAELTGALLLTADGRLARAPGPTCAIELLEPAGP